MTRNMGLADRVVRTLLAVVIGALYIAGAISGVVAAVLGLVAVVFLVTSAMGFCPAYLPFKITTTTKN
jgi:hypothetical protein